MWRISHTESDWAINIKPDETGFPRDFADAASDAAMEWVWAVRPIMDAWETIKFICDVRDSEGKVETWEVPLTFEGWKDNIPVRKT